MTLEDFLFAAFLSYCCHSWFRSYKYKSLNYFWREGVLFSAFKNVQYVILSLSLSLSPSFSVQEPDMQGVQISNRGQQVDASERTNGGVHVVL